MIKENLLKLADYLEHEISQEQFDMEDFRKNEYGGGVPFRDSHNCGTVGCSLGWAPFVPGLEPIPDDYRQREIASRPASLHWGRYSERVLDIGVEDKEWNFAFSNSWVDYDDTVEGAVARLRHLAETGEPGELPWTAEGE